MKFGEALERLEMGGRVARTGWNGTGMFIYLLDDDSRYEKCICMYTAQKTHQPGWLASQADMLSDDWVIV